MAKETSPLSSGEKPVWLLNREDVKLAFGSDDQKLTSRLLDQVTGALWLPESMPPERRIEVLDGALRALQALAPRDASEGLLATQMVATHSAALECLQRAAHPDQTFAGRELNLKHAVKLMGLYVRQLEALDKHRGKGQQKITVEHVNVHAGGQAIVGNVNPAAAAAHAAETAQPPANEDVRENQNHQKRMSEMARPVWRRRYL